MERDITFKVLTQILSVNCQFSFDIGNKGASDISNSYWRLSLIVQCGQVGISKKFRGRSQQNVFIRLLKASRETWEVFPFSFKWYHSTLHGEKFSGLSIFKTWWARWEESGSLRTMIIVSLSAVAFFYLSRLSYPHVAHPSPYIWYTISMVLKVLLVFSISSFWYFMHKGCRSTYIFFYAEIMDSYKTT